MPAIIMHHRKRRYYVPGCLHRISSISQIPITGETMEKNKTGPQHGYQAKPSQDILFLIENITLPGTSEAVSKPGRLDRNGA